jgi:hypothetical protein
MTNDEMIEYARQIVENAEGSGNSFDNELFDDITIIANSDEFTNDQIGFITREIVRIANLVREYHRANG